MADLPNQPVEDVPDAQPGYAFRETDKLMIILTDAQGNEIGETVLGTFANVRKVLVPVQAGGSTGQPAKVALELSTLTTTTGKTVVLTAKVTPGTAAVKQVEFFDGGDRIGSVLTASPYQYSYLVQTTGKHALVAKVTDADGNAVVSEVQYLMVTATGAAQPKVTLNPVTPTSAVLGTTFTLVASANVAGGTIAKVEFFDGANSIGEDSSTPYAISYTPGTLGQHVFSAKATDLNGNSGISDTQTIQITAVPTGPNQLPTASLTLNPASITAGQSTTLNATASDTDGTITKGEFFDGSTSLQVLTSPPYTYQYTPTGSTGNRTIKFVATDNSGGTASPTQVLAISAVQLPTPAAPTFSDYDVPGRTATVVPPAGYTMADLVYVLNGASPVAVPSSGKINVGNGAVPFGGLKAYVSANSNRNKGQEAVNEVEYQVVTTPVVFNKHLTPGLADRTITLSSQSQGVLDYNETNADGSNAIVAVAPNPAVLVVAVFFPTLNPSDQIAQFNFDPGNVGHEFAYTFGGQQYRTNSAGGSPVPLTFQDGSVLLSV